VKVLKPSEERVGVGCHGIIDGSLAKTTHVLLLKLNWPGGLCVDCSGGRIN
jgi:hypothetical protein